MYSSLKYWYRLFAITRVINYAMTRVIAIYIHIFKAAVPMSICRVTVLHLAITTIISINIILHFTHIEDSSGKVTQLLGVPFRSPSLEGLSSKAEEAFLPFKAVKNREK